MAGWLSIHQVGVYPALQTAEQMVAATARAVLAAGQDGPSHQHPAHLTTSDQTASHHAASPLAPSALSSTVPH